MGNEQLVYLSLAGGTLIARRPPGESIDIGTKTGVRFLTNKIIFMNDEGGEVIIGQGLHNSFDNIGAESQMLPAV